MTRNPNEVEASQPNAVHERQFYLIDALNLAYWCGRPPSLRVPLTVLGTLQAAGHDARLIFDASARHQLSTEIEMYERLLEFSDHAIEVASGQPADRELIKQARTLRGNIISRDKFRDHRKKFRKLIDDPARIISGFISEDHVVLPAIALKVPLFASGHEVWRGVRAGENFE